MSPIYEDESTTRDKLFELRKKNRCQVCHGVLDVFMDLDRGKAFLACGDWHRSRHEGIMREFSQYELNILTRREEMVEELGQEKATKLLQYEGVVSLTKKQSMEILETIWPNAPEVEVMKAAMVCHQYGLNPLMKHVFLIPFKRKREGRVVGEDWVTVLGIKATRLIAHRAGDFSYLDDTPRIMTEDEQKRIFGEVDNTRIWAITKLQDSKGNVAPGYGSWPKDEEPYGKEKGNTRANMAFIRSERNALDRLFSGEMPQGVEVIDEEYGVPSSLISEGGVKIGGAPGDKGAGEGEPAPIFTPSKQEPTKIAGAPPAEVEGGRFSINLEWLNESLKELRWTEDTAKTFVISRYKVDGRGTFTEVLGRLTREQAEEFTKELAERVAQKAEKPRMI